MNVYDFDKTIYAGDSTKDFFLFCLKRYPKIAIVLPGFTFNAFLYILNNTFGKNAGKASKEKMKESFFRFLRYLPDTLREVELFWEKNIKKVYGWYLNQKQEDDVIISASPEFLLEPICKTLGVALIASLNDARDGTFTGLNCYGEEKVHRFRKLYPLGIIEAFYSDSQSDRPMADIAQSAFIVKNGVIEKWVLI